jgi:phosphopantothenoylcysteine decarboxylase/phosphopantothenate--cysteine ligase
MKVLITCGGTREPIDAARSITNISTGRTGRLLAEAFAARGCEVHCLRASGSELPPGKGLRLAEFSSFRDLDEALKKALAAEAFTAVIHLAAVSDSSPALIEAGGRTFRPGREAKLDSSLPELRVTLKRNFKILDRIKAYAEAGGNPAPLLIGFKLTSGATKARVLAKVRALSSADLVVHNDLYEIKKHHIFHLYRNGARTEDCTGPKELAEKLYRFLKQWTSKGNKTPAGLTSGQDKQNPVGGRRLRSVRPGFRAKHNYASRPGRRGGGDFLRKRNRRAGAAQNRYAVYA